MAIIEVVGDGITLFVDRESGYVLDDVIHSPKACPSHIPERFDPTLPALLMAEVGEEVPMWKLIKQEYVA